MEVIAIADKVQKKTKKKATSQPSGSTDGSSFELSSGKKSKALKQAKDGSSLGGSREEEAGTQTEMEFSTDNIERALYAKVVKKCGNRHHWEDWAKDVALIANRHIERIKSILENPNTVI